MKITNAGMMLAKTTGMCAALLITTPVFAATQCGGASWYQLQNQTASGEQMNPSAFTAAHRSMRFGSKVRVTNRRNGRSVVVRINDRGPFTKGRVIDLSKAAAAKLGYLRRGHTQVCIERVG